jgi:hypothetical protein
MLMGDADKTALKNHLVEVLLNEPEKSLRDLLAETLHTTALHEYPEAWPQLLPLLLHVIQTNGEASSSDPNHKPSTQEQKVLRVHNALLALRKLVKRYEYKSKEQRGPLNDIVQQSFPLLLPLGQRLSSPNEHSLEAAMMLKQILKIFWSSTQFYLPTQSLQDLSNQISPWFDVLEAVVSKKLPEASENLPPFHQPTTVEERNAWPWWKVKKWAVQIMSRLFSRYGMPQYAEEEIKVFAQYFSTTVAPRFLGPVCETLNLRPSGQFCTDRVVHLCLAYVDLAVELAPTYRMMKPHLDFLLYKVCFPTMCLTTADQDLFRDDPHEFIRNENSPLADFYDPRTSAITLMTDLVKHRGKDVTQNLLQFLTNVIQQYQANPAQGNPIEKDGALLAFGSLSDVLLKKKKYSSQLEGLLVTSVFPDFENPVGFLRYRACWMMQRFSAVTWTDDGTHLRNCIHSILNKLSDPELPVQIEASKALRFLIEVEGAEQTLLPVLPQLLTEYFRIMNEIGNDEVVAALQTIIDVFGDHIQPHAVELVRQLSQAFHEYCDAGEDDDDAAMAAAQCLECIATTLKGISDRPDLFRHLEPQLVPLVVKVLGSDGEYIEYLEYGLDILTFLTYFPSPPLSPELWATFPLLYAAFDQYAFDYLNLMVIPLENFIQKDPTYFLSATDSSGDTPLRYIDLTMSMVAKTVGEDRSSEIECRKAFSLFLSILLNCKGITGADGVTVDAYIPMLNDLVLAKLASLSTDQPLTRATCWSVLGAAFYYNPVLQLQQLEARQVTSQLLTQWMTDVSTTPVMQEKWMPRKLTVLGWSSLLLALPTTQMPPTVQTVLPQLLTMLLHTVHQMKVDADIVEAEGDDDEEAEGDDDDDDEDDEDGGFDENEDVKDDVNEAYMAALQKISGGGSGTENGAGATGNASADLAKLLLGGSSDDAEAGLFGSYWDDDDDDDDNLESPADNINQLVFLSEALQHAFGREPESYQQVQASLPQESLQLCQALFATAQEEKAKEAAAAAALTSPQAQSSSPSK